MLHIVFKQHDGIQSISLCMEIAVFFCAIVLSELVYVFVVFCDVFSLTIHNHVDTLSYQPRWAHQYLSAMSRCKCICLRHYILASSISLHAALKFHLQQLWTNLTEYSYFYIYDIHCIRHNTPRCHKWFHTACLIVAFTQSQESSKKKQIYHLQLIQLEFLCPKWKEEKKIIIKNQISDLSSPKFSAP